MRYGSTRKTIKDENNKDTSSGRRDARRRKGYNKKPEMGEVHKAQSEANKKEKKIRKKET